MHEQIDLPEGVEVTVSLYFTTLGNELDAVLNLTMNTLPAGFPEKLDAPTFAGQLPVLEGMSWRLMTRAEVKDYKWRETNEGAEDDFDAEED